MHSNIQLTLNNRTSPLNFVLLNFTPPLESRWKASMESE